jgi:adenylosuccinate synthase
MAICMASQAGKRSAGYADVLIGLQFGDEGKAKVVDFLAPQYEVICRFNGGANAGHTIETAAGRIAFNQIPSGVLYPDKILVIGSGCVVNLEKMVDEIERLEASGFSLKGRLHISDQCSVIQPHHLIIDALTGSHIGTTKNGIGPAYADKALRTDRSRIVNVRLGDLLDEPAFFFAEIKRNFEFQAQAYHFESAALGDLIAGMEKALVKLTGYIERNTNFLLNQVERGAHVLFEGAQSYMLDVTKGMVPYVTSSSTVAAAAYVGGDLPPTFHRKTIGVAKAIMSRVGFGPFPSEFGGKKSEEYCMKDGGVAHNKPFEAANYEAEQLLQNGEAFDMGIALRMLGNEYGSVTGRPRRIGALDLVQLASVVRANGVDEIFLNKCDLLQDFARTKLKGIPLVDGYVSGGQAIDYVPASNKRCYDLEVSKKIMPAYELNGEAATSFAELPKALQEMLKYIESRTGSRILGVGTGAKREECVFQVGTGAA